MIVYANGKVIATDTDGNTQTVGIFGAEQDTLKVADMDSQEMLKNILLELQKINLQFYLITDENVVEGDL